MAQKNLARQADVRLRLNDDGRLSTLHLKRHIGAVAPVARASEAAAALGEALQIDTIDHYNVERIDERPGHQRVRLRQHVGGIELDDVAIDFHFSDDTLSFVAGSGASAALIDEAEPTLGEGMAKLKAKLALNRPEVEWDVTAKLVYTELAGRYALAWRVDAVGLNAPAHELVWLDAQSEGRVIKRANVLKSNSVQARLHPQNPSAGPYEWRGLPHLSLFVNGADVGVTDANGNHGYSGALQLTSLSGPFAKVTTLAEERFSYQGDADARIQFIDGDRRQSEVTAFYFSNLAHDWYANTFGYRGLDRQIQITVHSGDCLYNAYASGSEAMTFGDGCGTYDFAQTADVVFHEYTHLLTDEVSGIFYSTYSEAGAFNEGQSDYFACSITEDPNHGENLTGLFQRRCDSNARLERDYNGEAHSGAEVYSGAMWKLRTQFGRAVADTLAFYALHYLPHHPYFIDVRDAVLEADDERFGGAHAAAIRAAFDAHGINDRLQLFVASDSWKPASTSFTANLSAHAQGFDMRSLRFAWTFGDGGTAVGEEVEHTFTKKPYTAKVTATDDDGTTTFTEVQLGGGCASTGSDIAWLAFVVVAALRRSRVRAR